MLTTVAAGRVFDYSHAVGGLEMPQPIASASAAGDRVFVLNRQFEEVLDVPWDKTATCVEVNLFRIPTTPQAEEFLGSFSRYGSSEGESIWPAGLAIDSEESLYITDEWMNRVSVFNSSGDFLYCWGSEGSGIGELNRPSGIAIDHNDEVYVVDGMNHRVQKSPGMANTYPSSAASASVPAR